MKKFTLFLACAIGATMLLQSCGKIKDKVSQQIDPFNFTQQTVELDVPIITSTSLFTSSGIDTVAIDLDQIIKDNAGSNFGIANVQSLTIDKITITLLDHDANNYISNFDSAKVYVNSDAGIAAGKNDIVATVWVNDVVYDANNQKIVINGDPNLQLLDYLKGTKIYYYFRARARRTTSHPMRVSCLIDYKLVPKL